MVDDVVNHISGELRWQHAGKSHRDERAHPIRDLPEVWSEKTYEPPESTHPCNISRYSMPLFYIAPPRLANRPRMRLMADGEGRWSRGHGCLRLRRTPDMERLSQKPGFPLIPTFSPRGEGGKPCVAKSVSLSLEGEGL
jgi:hypothetical protein